MFGLTKVGLVPARMSLQSVRTFIPFKNGSVPTVYEPLPPKRDGELALSFLHKELYAKLDPTGKRRALIAKDSSSRLRSGDVIRVTYTDRSTVLGQVIAIKRSFTDSNILLRNKITKLGCEVRIPVFNPKIKNIELISQPKKYLSRAKHYYIRNTRLDVGDLEATLRKK